MKGNTVEAVAGTPLSCVLDVSPDGILVATATGEIVYANRSMEQLAGSDASLVGRHVEEFVPDTARDRYHLLRREFEQEPAPRSMGAGHEFALRRVGGEELPVEVSLSPLDGPGGHVIAAVRDVSARRAIDRRLAVADQQLALLGERERIGRDLHDVILQRLYGMGMSVEAIKASVDPTVADRLDSVVGEIDRVITEVRTIVFTLGAAGERGSLGQELADVIAESRRVLGFTPALRIDGPVESVLSDGARAEMVASMREALGNVARHAAATRVEVEITIDGPRVVMCVADDGVGPPAGHGQPRHGNGLLNLRARAAMFDGACELSAGAHGGARLRWSVPY